MNLADSYKLVRPACVAIALKKTIGNQEQFLAFGSGVCVDSDGIVATAKHVVSSYYEKIKGEKISDSMSPPDFIVAFSRRAKERYEMIYIKPIAIMTHDEHDSALLILPKAPFGGWPTIKLPEKWSINEGDEVAAAGFPLRSWQYSNMGPHLFSGVISQVGYYHEEGKGWGVNDITVDISIHPGVSGGPLFDVHTGHLLGLVKSQRIRELTTVDVLDCLGNQEDVSQEKESERQEFRVWTNMTHCVPWHIISAGIPEAKAQIAKFK